MDQQTDNFKKTYRMLRFHVYLVVTISLFIFIGPSIAAIRIGRSPVLGSIIAFLIACAFGGVFLFMNKRIVYGIRERRPDAWIMAVFLAIKMSLFFVGVPALKELMSKKNRALFLRK